MNKENKQRLKDLQIKYKREKYPTIPIDYIMLTKFEDNTANGLTKAITSFINFHGGQAERINTMGIARVKKRTDGKVIGVTWTKSTSTKGSADISAIIRGRSVKIEVKVGNDIQSPAQKKYQDDIERAGGVYIIARDFDSFVKWFDEFVKS
jgi:hypothetical protein